MNLSDIVNPERLEELRAAYAGIERIPPGAADKLCDIVRKGPDVAVQALAGAGVKFASAIARNECRRRNIEPLT